MGILWIIKPTAVPPADQVYAMILPFVKGLIAIKVVVLILLPTAEHQSTIPADLWNAQVEEIVSQTAMAVSIPLLFPEEAVMLRVAETAATEILTDHAEVTPPAVLQFLPLQHLLPAFPPQLPSRLLTAIPVMCP